jgi:putative ABC transport system permease protein
METLLQDLRYAVRMLLKAPSFSIVATIALALGIGANTAIFSVVNAVLLRPLPFANADRLMVLSETDSARGQQLGAVSYPNFADWRDQNHVFERMASYHNNDFIMTGRGESTRLQGAVVNADLFPLLGVTPMLGRGFLPAEDQPGDTGRVVVLSQELFQKKFSSDPTTLGQSMVLDGKPYAIVGVMPGAFQFPIQNDPVELWTTVALDREGKEPVTDERGAHYISVIGRLKPGIAKEQAQAEMTAIGARLEQQYPDKNLHRSVGIEPALEALVGSIRPVLLILLGAVGCVLLIACANVANLLLARAMSRHKEMAIRSALGASRLRVVRQLLTESVLLSLAGGALGLVLAVWWSDLLVALGKRDIPRALQVGMDWRVLGFTLGVSLLTGLVFGLVPALHSSKTQLSETLKEGARGGSGEGARRNRVRNVLVVAELAIAVVLLVGAGLLIQSLWRLRQVSPGFNPHNILTFVVGIPEVKYSSTKQAQFYRDLVSRIEALPGVSSASAIVPLPLSGDRYSISFEVEGRPVARGDQPSADFFAIGPGYFQTMGIPLIKGRGFTERDDRQAPPVIIVNETFARKHFPNEDPIGKRIKPGISTDEDKPAMREIIGMVADVKNRNLSSDMRPGYFLPAAQIPFNQMTVLVRTSSDPQSLVTTVQREVTAMDKELPVFNIKTMDEYISASVAAPRFNTTLLGIFAAVALVLTIVGLYGVMSYSVAQRTNEIGIRLALGAQTSDVLRLIVSQGLKLVSLGLALGLIGALTLMKLISTLLFGVTTKDPVTFAAVAVLLGIVALLACYIPARRAARVDPMEALHYE